MEYNKKLVPILIVFLLLSCILCTFLSFIMNPTYLLNKNTGSYSPNNSSGAATNFIEKNFYAIIVGIENYTGDLYDLDYCEDDAHDMINFLTVSCNIPNENIITLINNNATVISIDSAFTQINTSIKPEDDLLFYFSGHGGDGFFQTYYGVPANSSAYYNYTHMDNKLDSINCSNKYIIIDACYSGGLISVCSDLNRIIMTSCASSELCYEDATLQNGIFTYYFINALNNSSDTNSDDIISFEEMYNTFIYGGARNYAKQKYGSYQNAQLYDGINGESVPYPSIGAVTYELSNNYYLNYQFTIFGTGLIYNSSLLVNFDETEIYLNLTNTNSTNNAFGSYSGSIKLNTTEKPHNCTISVFIEGSTNKTITHTYIFVDPIPTVPGEEPQGIAFGSYFIISLFGSLFVLTLLNKKRLKLVTKKVIP